MNLKSNSRFWRLALAGAFLALAGCAAAAPAADPSAKAAQQGAAAGPPPLVQNCAIVAISSPTKYACNGKVYTSFQLAKLRQDWKKKNAQ